MDGIPDVNGGPWLDNDGDSCGDIATNTQVIKTLQQLRFSCVDADLDGSVDVSVCTAWDNNAGTVCNDLSGAFPGTNSKCSCDEVELGIAPVYLTVTKSPATQTVLVGGTASFTITAASTGVEDIQNVMISDPLCTTLTGPTGDDGDNILETTETWSWTCMTTNVLADFTNTATVTGTAVTSGSAVSEEDTADVTVIDASMAVNKTPATQSVLSGSNAVFTITAENTGTADLTGVMISDPQCDTLTGPTGDDGDNVLEASETWSWSCTVNNVTANFTNSVTVTATPPVGPDLMESDTADVTVESPAVTVSKTPATQTVVSGSNAVFTITADNTGNVDLTGVVISDPQCDTLTGPTGDDGDNVLETSEVWSWSCTVNNVTADFTNTATVTGTPPTGPDVSDNDSADVTVENPQVTVGKTPASQAVVSGGTANFTITADNTGNVDLTGVVISDPQCDTLTGPTGDDGDNVLETSEVWSWSCTVNNVTADFTNTATVTGTPPTGPDVSDNDSADVTVQSPSMVVSKTPDNQAVVSGGTANFTITAENDGNVDLTGVVISDPLCTTLTGPTGDDGDNVLEPGETWSWDCAVTNVTMGFINTATVTGTPPIGPDISDSDTGTVTVDVPSVSVMKSPASQNVLSGGTANFTITAQNTGNADLSSVVISDPQCTTLTGPTGDDGDNILEVGETWSWDCTVTNVTANFTNTATVTGTPPTGPDVSDTDTADVVVDAPGISLSKDPANQAVNSGDSAVFTLTVDNTGNADLSNVILQDPQCTTLTGPTGDDGDLVLETGETWSYTCTITNVTADLTNSATVTATPPTGPDVSDTDTADVTVNALLPIILASKSDTLLVDTNGDGLVGAGDTLLYEVVIDNLGPGTATGVVFTDTPDANTSLVVGSVITSQGTVTLGNGGGDTFVTVDIGTMLATEMVLVTFEVTLPDPIPDGVTMILNQGIASSNEVPDVPTNDPETGAVDDPTGTPIGSVVMSIPTLGTWGLWLLIGLLVAVACWRMRW